MYVLLRLSPSKTNFKPDLISFPVHITRPGGGGFLYGKMVGVLVVSFRV